MAAGYTFTTNALDLTPVPCREPQDSSSPALLGALCECQLGRISVKVTSSFKVLLVLVAVVLLFGGGLRGVDGALSSPSNDHLQGRGSRNTQSTSVSSSNSGGRVYRGFDKVLNRLDHRASSHNGKDKLERSNGNGNGTGPAFLSSSSGPWRSYPTTTTTPTTPTSSSSDWRRKERRLEEEEVELEEEEDDEGDEDDSSSYEDDDETPSHNALEKLSSWGYNYRSSYLASKKAAATTTVATTTTTTPPPTTTTTTTTTTPPPPPPPPPPISSSYSQYKWNAYGTRQAVEQSRRASFHSSNPQPQPPHNSYHHHNSNHQHHHGRHHNYNNNNNGYHHHNSRHPSYHPESAVKDAINHALKVNKEGACRTPKPKVVRVQQFYPHPGKTYIPHCTILHQCTDDTGCCKNDLTCSPKTTQRVELSFYTITLESKTGSSVERLVFYNHTECECRDKMDEQMPRDLPYDGDSSPARTGSSRVPDEDDFQTLDVTPAQRATQARCKCPSAFTERLKGDGISCSCDCFDKETACLRQKRGRDFFSMQDKWCIQSGRCSVPLCAYGSYIHLAGRCPRKKEKYSMSWHRYLTN